MEMMNWSLMLEVASEIIEKKPHMASCQMKYTPIEFLLVNESIQDNYVLLRATVDFVVEVSKISQALFSALTVTCKRKM